MAQGNLRACLPVTLTYEGGLSTLRSDPGNWTGGRVGVGILRGTNLGIAASAHPGLDIVHLDRTAAEAIYRLQYWTPAGCEGLPAGLDLSVFDAAVNSGVDQGRRWLAGAQARCGAADVPGQIRALASARLSFLRALRGWARFGRGWSVRVAGVEARALRMALDAARQPPAVALGGGGAAHARAAATKRTAAHAGTALAGAAAVSGAPHAIHHGAGHVGMLLLAGCALALSTAVALAFAGWRDALRAAAHDAELHAHATAAGPTAVAIHN